MFRRISVAAVVVSMLALTAPAMAGKPQMTGDIWVEMDGAAAAAATVGVSDAWSVYGDEVSFGHRITGDISKQGRLYVSVVCTQGDTVVYQWSGDPSFGFPLVDQAGQGLEWNGAEADCTGSLVYRVKKGKKTSISYLDTAPFHVYGQTG